MVTLHWRIFLYKKYYLKDVIEPLNSKDAKKIASNKIVYLCTGSQGEPLAALSRISRGEHQHVQVKTTDTIIFRLFCITSIWNNFVRLVMWNDYNWFTLWHIPFRGL